jgi:hypothetical protein
MGSHYRHMALQRGVRTAQYITGAELLAIQDLARSLCTRTGLYKLTHTPTQTIILTLHTQSSYALPLLCLWYNMMPSHLTPIHIYLYHSSIPANCKSAIGTDPVHSLLSRVLISCVFVLPYVIF